MKKINQKKSLLKKISEEEWDNFTSKKSSVFFSRAWQNLLKTSLNVKTIYIYDEVANDGTIIQTFTKGPFQVSYVAFPIGGTINGRPLSSLGVSKLKNIISDDIKTLKVNASGFRNPEMINGKVLPLPETAILKLNEYDALKIAKIRRDINRSKRFNVQISPSCKKSHASNMFRLYQQTIKRNKGVEKYNLTYFEELMSLSQKKS